MIAVDWGTSSLRLYRLADDGQVRERRRSDQGVLACDGRFGEEPGAALLVNLLIPFAAYLLAEEINASGILAAVAAGITMSYVELSGRTSGSMRVQRTAVWNTLQFSFNGFMFVLLGEQLPRIATESGYFECKFCSWANRCWSESACWI